MIGDRGRNLLRALAAAETEPHRLLAANRLAAHIHLAEGYVSRAFCIKPHDFFIDTRGPKHVAEARQLIMYLAHVEFGLPLTAVGRRYFRDRSTASYACRTIEHRREDPLFDQLVCEIEDLITLRKDPLFISGAGGQNELS